jgi:glycosyltransferase involved in cell wall biosynthesis
VSAATATLRGKRIVFVVAWPVMGGAERNALQVLLHFARHEGAHVQVLALTAEEGRFRTDLNAAGIPWHPYPVHWFGGKARKAQTLAGLAVRLRRLRPDVLMPYTTRPNVLCGLVWRFTGASVCVWNQRDLSVSTKFSPEVVERAARRSSLLVANSITGSEFLVSRFGVRPDRVRVVLDTVELPTPVMSRSEWRARRELREDAVVATMLAHFHHGKDHETVLRAWRHVVDRVGDGAVLLLAGRSAGAKDAAKAVAYDLDLGSSVRFLEDVVDVSGLLAASDIGVLSSQSESAPNALLESMAAGLPVVGTDVPGIREILPSEQTSFLATPRDAAALAAALVQLIDDQDARERLGRRNAEHIAAREATPAGHGLAVLLAQELERA